MDTSFSTLDSVESLEPSFYSNADAYDSEDDTPIPPATPLWPSYVSAFPPIPFLIKQSLLAVRPPTPLPQEYQQDLISYDDEKLKKEARLKELQDGMVAIEKEISALPTAPPPTARSWASKAGSTISVQRKAILQEKLEKEKMTLIATKKEIQAHQDTYSTLLNLRLINSNLQALYKDYKENQVACYNFSVPIPPPPSPSASDPSSSGKEEAWRLALRATDLATMTLGRKTIW